MEERAERREERVQVIEGGMGGVARWWDGYSNECWGVAMPRRRNDALHFVYLVQE